MTEQSIYANSSNAVVVPKSTTIRFDGVDDIGIVIDRPMNAIEVTVKMVEMLNRFSDAMNAGRKLNTEPDPPQPPALLDRVRMWLFGNK